MLAVLLMNVFAPTIDHYVVEGNIKKRTKRWAKAQLKTYEQNSNIYTFIFAAAMV